MSPCGKIVSIDECVCGCVCVSAGKSFFASMLLGKFKAFALGHTVEPETAGVWCAFQRHDGHVVVVVDSEGLGDAIGTREGRVRPLSR